MSIGPKSPWERAQEENQQEAKRQSELRERQRYEADREAERYASARQREANQARQAEERARDQGNRVGNYGYEPPVTPLGQSDDTFVVPNPPALKRAEKGIFEKAVDGLGPPLVGAGIGFLVLAWLGVFDKPSSRMEQGRTSPRARTSRKIDEYPQ